MTGNYATSYQTAKLGLMSQGNCAVGTFPAIDPTHSIMLEFYLHWDAPYIPTSYSPLFTFRNAAASQFFNSYIYNTVSYPGDVSMSLWETGWDEVTRIPQPQTGNRGRDKYWVFLLDRTNSRKQIYEDGSIAVDDAIAAEDPNFNAAANVFTILGAPKSFCGELLLVRFTVLTSVPANLADMIAYMHQAPTALHPDLHALAPSIASTWSFSDVIIDDGGHSMRTLDDTGVVGGVPVTASIDLEQEMSIGARATLTCPDFKTYYHLGDSHYASNGGILGHNIAGGAHVLEILMDLQWNYLRHGTDSHYVFLVDAGVGLIFFRQVANVDYYELGIGKWGTTYRIYRDLFPFNVMHIVMDGDNYVYIDGQQIVYDAGEVPPDYTGTWPAIYLGGDIWYTFRHHVYGFRFWNYPLGVVPAGCVEELRSRASSPWQASAVLGTPNLEYLLNDDIDPASLIWPCTGAGGAGCDLTFAPAGQFQDIRQPLKT